MVELFYLTPHWQRYAAPDLHAMFASQMGVAPIPMELETVSELSEQLHRECVYGDDEPVAPAIDVEEVLDELARQGCWLAPDRSIFLLDRSHRTGPDNGGSKVAKAA